MATFKIWEILTLLMMALSIASGWFAIQDCDGEPIRRLGKRATNALGSALSFVGAVVLVTTIIVEEATALASAFAKAGSLQHIALIGAVFGLIAMFGLLFLVMFHASAGAHRDRILVNATRGLFLKPRCPAQKASTRRPASAPARPHIPTQTVTDLLDDEPVVVAKTMKARRFIKVEDILTVLDIAKEQDVQSGIASVPAVMTVEIGGDVLESGSDADTALGVETLREKARTAHREQYVRV